MAREWVKETEGERARAPRIAESTAAILIMVLALAGSTSHAIIVTVVLSNVIAGSKNVRFQPSNEQQN